MRILIIPSWYPTPSNPVNGIFVRQQAEALGKAHDVRVLYLDVMPRGQRRRPKRYRNKTPDYTEEIIEVPNRLFLWQFYYVWYLIRAFRKLRRKFNPDVIHAHVAVPAGFGASVLRYLGIPLVLTEHNGDFKPWLVRPGLRWMARLAFASADISIAVSATQRRDLLAAFPRTQRTVIVPNTVDTELFTPSPLPPAGGGYKLLFVGLLSTHEKGVPELLQALAELRRETFPVHLDLIGGGQFLEEYERQAADMGLSEVTTFHGYRAPTTVAQMLRESHALILPSHTESQGVVVLEALVSGRPVVSTRCGGPEALINASNGLLVEPKNASELAVAIKKLFTDIHSYDPNRIASEARKLFSHKAVAAALTKVYEDVLLNILSD